MKHDGLQQENWQKIAKELSNKDEGQINATRRLAANQKAQAEVGAHPQVSDPGGGTLNVFRSKDNTFTSPLAFTVAWRGRSVNSATSPKYCPLSRSPTLTPAFVQLTDPSSRM